MGPTFCGDILLAMSDGLIEANHSERGQLGFSAVEKAIAKAAPQGCEAVVQVLVQLQKDWQAGQPLRDDTTIMAVAI